MKLVIFGHSVRSSSGNGHSTVGRGLCEALGARGHRVVFFERDVSDLRRDERAVRGVELVLYERWEGVRARAHAELADAEVAMVTSDCQDGLAASRLVFDSRCELRVYYELADEGALGQRGGTSLASVGPRGLTDYDLVLSSSGGANVDHLKTALGARRVCELHGSFAPEMYVLRAEQLECALDMTFRDLVVRGSDPGLPQAAFAAE